MSAKIIDGRHIAEQIKTRIRAKVQQLAETGLNPGLAVILVGEDPASISYVTAKQKACQEVGIRSFDHRLPASTTQKQLMALIAELNHNHQVHGILVQLPLPSHIDTHAVIEAIDPNKDVDGFHPINVGRLVIGQGRLLPCTPRAVVELLISSQVELEGAHVVIVGRSNIVGRPLANMLLQKAKTGNATVTVCHSRTKDISVHTRQADILVAAMGSPNTITADMVRPGAVVIDVGVNRIPDPGRKSGYRLVGDVDFEAVKEVASMITPVPGGVGPMTIAMLLANTVLAATFQQ
ncbi:MAG: bifunctional methylenetetrahydrofolate dehydrogenase/methenyltetrahydrofolate cyclohydrolase FolD [Sedimentisphaerales bacterium]|nr:bifunctional methylenetetrahydrofolate dehydrogenase/methenyltetrahydrofolate cyclohydrolase FolD [Sedimentisphaerales bacterium]